MEEMCGEVREAKSQSLKEQECCRGGQAVHTEGQGLGGEPQERDETQNG